MKKPTVLVRPFTIIPKSSCGNDVLNALIRIVILSALIGCAAYFYTPSNCYIFIAVSFVILLIPLIYVVFTYEAPQAEGFVDSQDFLQFYKPQPNPILPKEEKDIATIIPNGTGSPWNEPTPANPFMNLLLTDLKEPNKWKPQVDGFNPEIKQQLDDYFRIQWFSDPTDVFGKNQGQRQFYTMPSNSIPNDRKSYQEWLYKIPGLTCKEGGGAACLPGTDGGQVPWLNKDS